MAERRYPTEAQKRRKMEGSSTTCNESLSRREAGAVAAAPGLALVSEETTTQQAQLNLIEENEYVLATIFSFLGSSSISHHDLILGNSFASKRQRQQEMNNKDALFSVRDIAIIYTQLCRVSKTWKKVCDKNAPYIFGTINANLNKRKVEHIIPCIVFLCQHKLCIGTLLFNSELNDIRLLEQLLTTCDTSKLTYMKALCRCNSAPSRNDQQITTLSRASAWLNEAYYKYYHPQPVVIDLLSDDDDDDENGNEIPWSCAAMAQSIGVPFDGQTMQRDLHNCIAENCPNLTELEINVGQLEQDTNCRNYLSQALWSHPKLQKLDLVLENQDGMIISRIVENLTNLTELLIMSALMFNEPNNLFHITSTTITNLNIESMGQDSWISGALPNLTTLVHTLSPLYGGIALEPSDVVLLPQTAGSYYVNAGDLCFRAGRTTAIRKLTIPPTCEVIAKDFGHERYRVLRFSKFRDATLTTYD